MSKPLYKDNKEINSKARAYFKANDLVAPASFRVWMGYSKQNLSSWKKSNRKQFDLIKAYETQILAKIEEYAIYGQAHPDIASKMVVVTPSTSYFKDGKIKSEKNDVTVTGKYNQIGAMFILKAYDRDQYIPELEAKQELNQIQDRKTIIINADNTSNNKIPLLEKKKIEKE